MSEQNLFWEDLVEDLADPEFLRTYVAESIRIATVDAIVNTLDTAREAAGLSKAALARAINAEPATVRRLLAVPTPNPTLGTLTELAAALGLKVSLQPMSAQEHSSITEPLLRGQIADTKALAAHLSTLRVRSERTKASA